MEEEAAAGDREQEKERDERGRLQPVTHRERQAVSGPGIIGRRGLPS